MGRVAAVDCGTNSIRLLIAEIDDTGGLVDVERRMEIVRLGQGVDATGRLAPDALERTFAVARDYAAAIQDAGVSRTRFVATSATRDAANRAEFEVAVEDIFGVRPEVVSGAEEAQLSFAGATAGLAAVGVAAPPYLVVDIGGGSTEFVLGGDGTGVSAACSVDVGCVRMLERHLHADPPEAAQVAAARADVDAAIEQAAAVVPLDKAGSLVGVAGTVTTLTAIALGLDDYDPARVHRARVPAPVVQRVAARLLSAPRAERATIGALHPGRVDVIAAGALILDRVLRRTGLEELVASEHDILDGIAASLLVG